jgi:selenocysteine lyase/cysteine desulfurase
MLDNQSHLFNLPEDATYLNCAYMSPMLKSVTEIGTKAIIQKENPTQIFPKHFFDLPGKLRQEFAQLIGVENPDDCAIVPSASYAIENVAKNLNANKGDNIIVLEEQFPSNIYPWKSLEKNGSIIKIVTAPTIAEGRSANWNLKILDAIDGNTKLLAIPHVHWTDGTLFDLKAIRAATKAVGALLVIDGSQSIGALPFSISDYEPDMVVAVGYKWMLGPYSTGVAYYGKYFHDKLPIENSWLHRLGSEDFAGLVNYEDKFQPGARRFEVGESSNFILTPMLTESIRQLNEWGVQNIQDYCQNLTSNAVKELRNMGFNIEDDNNRAHHLFGIRLPQGLNPNALKEEFAKMNVFVSVRGKSVRIATHLYNDQNDMDKLVEGFKKFSNAQ